jgi:outer membrane protein OmpA-like peptidoglycan-associated protein
MRIAPLAAAALSLLFGCQTGVSTSSSGRPSVGPSLDPACAAGDSDHDRIADICDRCPNDGENYNGLDDADGCPDHVNWMPEPPVLRIRFAVGITFEPSSSQLSQRAAAALNGVAAWLRSHPEDERIACLGNAAPNETNAAQLALDRAEAVRRALVAHGVEPLRLSPYARGVGAPSGTPLHPAEGRNVTIHVLRHDGVELERWNGSSLEPVTAMPGPNVGLLILAGLPVPGCIGLDFVPSPKGCPD